MLSPTLPINKMQTWKTPQVAKADLRRQASLVLEADCAKAFAKLEKLLTPIERRELDDLKIMAQALCDRLWQTPEQDKA